jgi:hypothetical protein
MIRLPNKHIVKLILVFHNRLKVKTCRIDQETLQSIEVQGFKEKVQN